MPSTPTSPVSGELSATEGATTALLPRVTPSVPRGTPSGPVSFDDLTEILARLDRVGLERMMTAGQLSGMFAHELSNILTPLLSYAQLALASPDDGALSRKALTKAVDGAQRAAFLAEALLGKRGGPEQRDRDLESALDPLLALQPSASIDDGIRRALTSAFRTPGTPMDRSRVGIHIDAEPDLRVAAHPIALEHVLQNLIANACLAMRRADCANSGGESLHIIARRVPCSTGNTPTAAVEIRIRDTGPGVPDYVRARLFEPFVTSRAGQGGFGLGLAVCKRLVEQAGGTITLAPRERGTGAEFIVTLPAARPEPASNPDTRARRLAA